MLVVLILQDVFCVGIMLVRVGRRNRGTKGAKSFDEVLP